MYAVLFEEKVYILYLFSKGREMLIKEVLYGSDLIFYKVVLISEKVRVH